MPYNFIFDFSKIPFSFYSEIELIGQKVKTEQNYLEKLHSLISKYKIQEQTGLEFCDVSVLLGDLINLEKINTSERNKFLQTKKRALFLPHCTRKYMDNRCKAIFDTDIPSYKCSHCSPDCLVNNAEHIAKEKGYDVYLVPGGSCIPKILHEHRYEGIIGVACGEEIKTMGLLLTKSDVAGQAIPLIKNGCTKTIFNIETLLKVL